jgi:hypothetical protein
MWAQITSARQLIDIDYSLVSASIGEGLVETPFLNFKAALRVAPHADSEVLSSIREPYFSRSYAKYTSHQNTPFQLEDAPHPGNYPQRECHLYRSRLGQDVS